MRPDTLQLPFKTGKGEVFVASNFPSKLAEAGISVYAETRFFYLKYLN